MDLGQELCACKGTIHPCVCVFKVDVPCLGTQCSSSTPRVLCERFPPHLPSPPGSSAALPPLRPARSGRPAGTRPSAGAVGAQRAHPGGSRPARRESGRMTQRLRVQGSGEIPEAGDGKKDTHTSGHMDHVRLVLGLARAAWVPGLTSVTSCCSRCLSSSSARWMYSMWCWRMALMQSWR